MRRKVKELDPYLKGRIGEAIIQLQELGETIKCNQVLQVEYTTLAIGQKTYMITSQINRQQVIFAKVAKLKDWSIVNIKLRTYLGFADEEGQEWTGYDYAARKI